MAHSLDGQPKIESSELDEVAVQLENSRVKTKTAKARECQLSNNQLRVHVDWKGPDVNSPSTVSGRKHQLDKGKWDQLSETMQQNSWRLNETLVQAKAGYQPLNIGFADTIGNEDLFPSARKPVRDIMKAFDLKLSVESVTR